MTETHAHDVPLLWVAPSPRLPPAAAAAAAAPGGGGRPQSGEGLAQRIWWAVPAGLIKPHGDLG